jgi:Fe-S-cluster-containing dehydrogenase component
MKKRQFLKGMILFCSAEGLVRLSRADGAPGSADPAAPGVEGYRASEHWYGMGIEVEKCIGCNRCVEACKAENGVSKDPFNFRTWVERYRVKADGETEVHTVGVPGREQAAPASEKNELRSFFVPKLCNHCAHPPCVQVCPVGATFSTKDGVVLVDQDRCIGCRYCIQACPYGARYFNHDTNTADKCTFCYHRVTRGLQPACVEACPTGARVWGDLRSKASRLVRFQRMNKVNVLKPGLNTDPKVFYAQLDGEVR